MTQPSPLVIETVAALIGFRTTFDDTTQPLLDFVAARLARIARLSLLPDATGRKSNLFATIGPDVPGGIILSGHCDVVPAPDSDPWTTPPFAADIRGGRLYGRGACDMKGFVGTALALAPALAAMPLKRPVHLAISYDEEVGCVGVWGIADFLKRSGLKPAACIVGEPTLMAPVIGHKGKTSWTCEIAGKAEHSSRAPYAVNAVELAARMIASIADLAEARSRTGPFDPLQDPPYSTLSVGPVAGGRQLNVVPDFCRFEFEMRHLPDDPPASAFAIIQARARELEAAARRKGPEATIRLTQTNAYPGFSIQPDAPVVRLAESLSGLAQCGRVGFGTEAGVFLEAGVPTVVCGPGSVAQAHIIDEFIALEQLARCERFILGLGRHLCETAP
jgi:acetylornithine deacetylase